MLNYLKCRCGHSLLRLAGLGLGALWVCQWLVFCEICSKAWSEWQFRQSMPKSKDGIRPCTMHNMFSWLSMCGGNSPSSRLRDGATCMAMGQISMSKMSSNGALRLKCNVIAGCCLVAGKSECGPYLEGSTYWKHHKCACKFCIATLTSQDICMVRVEYSSSRM